MSKLSPWKLLCAGALAGLAAGCAMQGPNSNADTPAPRPANVVGSPFSDRAIGYGYGDPLLIDRTDLRIGTTVHYRHIPTVSEINDLRLVQGLMRVLVALPQWPTGFEPLEPLNQLPAEVELAIVLPGYPATREAAEVWNYLGTRTRIMVLVNGPPPHPGTISDLNTMRGLERVIATMDEPNRAGFERLQRPLSFRKIVE